LNVGDSRVSTSFPPKGLKGIKRESPLTIASALNS
jgi:hypothetical protein